MENLGSDLVRALAEFGPHGGDYRAWQVRARLERMERTDVGRRRCRDLIGLFRIQHILQDMTAEELIERILAWQPPLPGGLTYVAVEREVARAVFAGEPGTEGMVCPERWRDSLQAGQELLERYEAIPDRELAEWWESTPSADEGDADAIERWFRPFATRHGITDDLFWRAIGPDADEIDEDEAALRIEEYVLPVLEGPKGWRVHQFMKYPPDAVP